MPDPLSRRRTRPSLHNFVEDFRWALRYWWRFHREENLFRNPLRHAWRYAYVVAPRNRRNDRLKYR